METNTHQVLEIFQHLWAYISGLFLTLVATFRLWWYDRKQTKKMVTDNAQAIVLMNERMVTQDDLQACREDVRAVDNENLQLLHKEIKDSNKDNAQQHQDIMKEVNGVMKQIVRLHSND